MATFEDEKFGQLLKGLQVMEEATAKRSIGSRHHLHHEALVVVVSGEAAVQPVIA